MASLKAINDESKAWEDFVPPPRPPPDPRYQQAHAAIGAQQAKDIASLLIGFRLINAICIATFFQPDEFFQSLEPAWQMAFGADSGAWITWEWHHQLRSSLHPMMFAALYYVFDKIMTAVSFFPQFQAIMYVTMPRVLQSLFAAAGDWCTWRLAERIYGKGSNTAWTVLYMTFASPWLWFASTRTFSNSLETSLTIIALYFWPWQLSGGPATLEPEMPSRSSAPKEKTTAPVEVLSKAADITRLRLCLLFAGFACILRPTNLLIWMSLVTISVTRFGLTGPSIVKFNDFLILLREAVLCGSIVLTISAVSDRVYYGMWTFPPYQWLNFNITQSLAVFYGVNDWHYYMSQGLPLLLTTYLPFAVIPLFISPETSTSLPSIIANARFQITFMILTTISTLSLISHKEVRFIYPILPLLHILAAPHILSFFTSTALPRILNRTSSSPTEEIIITSPLKKYLLIALLTTNILISGYTTLIHQRGVISAVNFIRTEYETIHLSSRGLLSLDTTPGSDDVFNTAHESDGDPNEMFVGFLMPCHSTPWRSHLFHPMLRAWALTCEPPVDMPAGSVARQEYRDEADRFYDDMLGFLQREVNTRERPWPRFVVGFEGIERVLREYYEGVMPGWVVRRRWSGFNSHWHEDWRRRGRVVVWEFVDGSLL